MAYGDKISYRDNRSGRYRRPLPYEKNRHYRIDTLSKGLANFAFKTANGMAEAAQGLAEELVTYARNNAPWDDRTGAAREGLTSEVVLENESLEVNLFHTIDYGIWLEIRWGGKYAIIIPTIEQLGPKIFDKMNDLLGETIYYA